MTTLLATGDLIIDEPDPDSYFEPARPVLRAADIVIGHVEVPFTLRRAGTPNIPLEARDPAKLSALANAGVQQGLFGSPKDLPWPPNSPANDSARQGLYHQDLDKARTLVQQAGATGAALTMLLTAGNSETSSFAQIIQADLQSIGLQPTIQAQEPATWRTTTASLKGWHINLATSDYSQLLPSSLATMSAWWSYSVGQTGYKDPQYEQLVTTIGTEPDASKRNALYGQLNDLLLDQSFAMGVAPLPSRLLARPNVQGIRFTRHESLDFSATSLA
jgi:peptide/nickel transport system substrate-binding protein